MKDIKSGDLVRVNDKARMTLKWPKISGLVIEEDHGRWVVLWSNGTIAYTGPGWLERIST